MNPTYCELYLVILIAVAVVMVVVKVCPLVAKTFMAYVNSMAKLGDKLSGKV